MAEKKFFVDINLQGSALTNAKIGTNSGIGSTEGAFGYDSASHRLQYFNGTATKNVANLSDISAVTGGLIFQGGYDPINDSPDITDGTALKGFFWAATAAGTFLGESVQVGDSIVAKVDNAGATIADWLILQGNVVIATDSVDGISRLATQTEANDGAASNAVVITPATLQGKIDAQITPEISSKLPLDGSQEMTGNLQMGGWGITQLDSIGKESGSIAILNDLDAGGTQKITGLAAPTDGGDAANKTYVDDNTSNKLPLAGGTMTGSIDMGNHSINNANNITASNTTSGTIITNNLYDLDAGSISFGSNLNGDNAQTIINLPAPTNGGDAANKTYVDTAASTAQANAEATASADATTKADAVQAAAEAYADSLAPNYDAAGSASQALTDANAYTDTGLAAKLNVAGGYMSGNIDMLTNTISNVTIQNAYLIDMNGNSITNVLDPTSPFDATNKGYVDATAGSAAATAAATAESNANAYTDTEIAALAFLQTIASADWYAESDGTYSVSVTHNLNAVSPNVTTYLRSVTGEYKIAEFEVLSMLPDLIQIYSNVLPSTEVNVRVSK
jgi:hypothetical protein